MTALDDPDHLNFEATYEFMKLPLLCKEVKKLRGTSGTVHATEDNVSPLFSSIHSTAFAFILTPYFWHLLPEFSICRKSAAHVNGLLNRPTIDICTFEWMAFTYANTNWQIWYRIWARHRIMHSAIQKHDLFSPMALVCRWLRVRPAKILPTAVLWKFSAPAGINTINLKNHIRYDRFPLNTSIQMTRKTTHSHGSKWCHAFHSA